MQQDRTTEIHFPSPWEVLLLRFPPQLCNLPTDRPRLGRLCSQYGVPVSDGTRPPADLICRTLLDPNLCNSRSSATPRSLTPVRFGLRAEDEQLCRPSSCCSLVLRLLCRAAGRAARLPPGRRDGRAAVREREDAAATPEAQRLQGRTAVQSSVKGPAARQKLPFCGAGWFSRRLRLQRAAARGHRTFRSPGSEAGAPGREKAPIATGATEPPRRGGAALHRGERGAAGIGGELGAASFVGKEREAALGAARRWRARLLARSSMRCAGRAAFRRCAALRGGLRVSSRSPPDASEGEPALASLPACFGKGRNALEKLLSGASLGAARP